MPLYNGSNTAPGMYGGEEDNSFSPTQRYPSTGAMVGEANRGQVGIPVRLTSKEEWRSLFGRRDATLTYAHFCAERFLEIAQTMWFIRVDTEANYGSCSIRTVNGFATGKAATNGYLDPVTEHNQLPDEILLIYGANPGSWNNNLRVLLYPDTNDIENELFILQVFETNMNAPVETHRVVLRDKVNGVNKQLNVEYVLENESTRIRAKINVDNPQWIANEGKLRLVNAIVTQDLSYGDNGRKANNGDIMNAWEEFSNEDDFEIRILINAGYTDTGVQNRMLQLCEERRDCFAILDIPSDMQTVARAVDYRRNILNANTSFGAIYCSDILEVTDEGQEIYVPCSGAIAAVFAQSDAAEAEWWAPAGVTRGVIKNINGIRHKYSQNERNILDQNQINFIHKFSGYGFCVWGAQTLQAQKSALQDIPVRRLFNTIETTAKYDGLVILFDPNDEFLWGQLKGLIEAILRPIMNARGLYFYAVKCDKDTNPPAQVANGDIAAVYIIQPMRYAKRILFTTTVAATGQLSTAVDYVTADTNI
jgi:hypothetical protein